MNSKGTETPKEKLKNRFEDLHPCTIILTRLKDMFPGSEELYNLRERKLTSLKKNHNPSSSDQTLNPNPSSSKKIQNSSNSDKTLNPKHSSSNKGEKLKTFRKGQVVFAAMKQNSSTEHYHAAIIVDGEDCYLKKATENCAWVYWFQTKNVSMVRVKNIIDFAPNLMDVVKATKKKDTMAGQKRMDAVKQAINVFGTWWNKSFTQESFKPLCSQFLKEYSKRSRNHKAEDQMPESIMDQLKSIRERNKKNVEEFIKQKKREVCKSEKRAALKKKRTSGVKKVIKVDFGNANSIQSLRRAKQHLVNGKHWYESPINIEEICAPPTVNDRYNSVIKNEQGRGGQPVRVLSLFDGIGCGILALKGLNIEIEEYYASEIDRDAITITNIHHGGSNKFHQLGDVNDISSDKLKEISPIHILLGGSPCNDLSVVNHSRKGLQDIEGTGPLFFQYFRILKELAAINQQRGIDFYWLYENVTSMEKTDKNTITQFLGIDPVQIDASNYSPQKRSRLYWGNIPGLEDIPKDSSTACYSLQSVLTPNCQRMATSFFSQTITTNPVTINQDVIMNDHLTSLWMNELEKLFGLPEHYTDYGLSANRRQKLIGRGWSVPVIRRILEPLREIFLTRN